MVKKTIVALLFISAIIVIFPRTFMENISGPSAIDNGWRWALRFFIEHKDRYSWGKDVVYTYGPLGFLSFRCSSFYLAQFTYDVYLVSLFGCIFSLIRKEASVWILCLTLFVSMWEVGFLMEIFNILAVTIILQRKRHYWLSWFVLINVVLSFYIKLNLIVPSGMSLAILIWLFVSVRKYKLTIYLLTLFTLLNFMLIWWLNVSVVDYVRNGIELIRNYSACDYSYRPKFEKYLSYGIMVTVISLVLCLFSCSKNIIKTLLVGNIALVIFFLFKEGYTRLDEGHYIQFLALAPIALFCLYQLSPSKLTLYLILLTIPINFFNEYGNIQSLGKQPVLSEYVSELFTPTVDAETGYSKGSYDYYANQCIHQKFNKNQNWHPRPAFQTIVAVSPYLDSLNAAYYLGPDAPDTIFYDNTTVDRVNPIWSDPQCQAVILSHYEYKYKDAFGELVLSRRKHPLTVSYTLILDTVMPFEQVLQLQESDRTITAKMEVNITLWGKIRTIFFQPPNITLNGYRYITSLYNDRNLIINGKSISFETDEENLVEKDIRIRLYKTTTQ